MPQEALAPLVGGFIIFIIPLLIALVAHAVQLKLKKADRDNHLAMLGRRRLLERKKEEKNRLESVERWEHIENLRRARNICLLVAMAALEFNVLAFFTFNLRPSVVVGLSMVLAAVVAFGFAVWLAFRKQERPDWVTTRGFYRDLAMSKKEKESKK